MWSNMYLPPLSHSAIFCALRTHRLAGRRSRGDCTVAARRCGDRSASRSTQRFCAHWNGVHRRHGRWDNQYLCARRSRRVLRQRWPAGSRSVGCEWGCCHRCRRRRVHPMDLSSRPPQNQPATCQLRREFVLKMQAATRPAGCPTTTTLQEAVLALLPPSAPTKAVPQRATPLALAGPRQRRPGGARSRPAAACRRRQRTAALRADRADNGGAVADTLAEVPDGWVVPSSRCRGC